MKQVLICLKKNEVVNIDVLDSRRRELIALGKALLEGNIHSIAKHVEKAFDAGASQKDIVNVLTFIVGDVQLLNSIIELFRAMSNEEYKRAEYISVVDDVRED